MNSFSYLDACFWQICTMFSTEEPNFTSRNCPKASNACGQSRMAGSSGVGADAALTSNYKILSVLRCFKITSSTATLCLKAAFKSSVTRARVALDSSTFSPLAIFARRSTKSENNLAINEGFHRSSLL